MRSECGLLFAEVIRIRGIWEVFVPGISKVTISVVVAKFSLERHPMALSDEVVLETLLVTTPLPNLKVLEPLYSGEELLYLG